MNDNYPFGRQIKVQIFPLTGQAYTFEGDGSPQKLRIKFMINKRMGSTGIPSIIQIYNLTKETRNKLSEATGVTMIVSAGWQNTKIIQLFIGSLLYATHQREGAAIVTSLMSIEGFFGLFKRVVTGTVLPGVKIQEVVETLAKQIPEVSVDKKLIKVPDYVFGNQGYSYAGTIDKTLDRLARSYGFTWWIDNGVFYAKTDGQPLNTLDNVLINESNGLLRADPMLSFAGDLRQDQQIGVTVSSLLNPRVKVGFYFTLQSILNDKLNGTYEVHNLTNIGDTHSNEWKSTIESLKFVDSSAWK